jgi:hypothetical protein
VPLVEDGGGRGPLAAPDPDLADSAVAQDLLERLLGVLPEGLRPLAMMMLDGRSQPEMARALCLAPYEARRSVRTVRHEWRKVLAPLYEGLEEAAGEAAE